MGRQLVYPSRNSSTKDIPDRQPNVAEHTYRFRRVYGALSAAWAFYLFEIIGIPVRIRGNCTTRDRGRRSPV